MASTGETGRLARRPALDGLRGIAILMVVLDHLALRGLSSPGTVGVTLFFTLSGFLITTLLLEELGSTGKTSMRGFYVRRAARLLPALGVFLIAMLVASWLIGPAAATPLGVLISATYIGNWFAAGGYPLNGLQHLWSLAIEEQFYLVWPVALASLHRRGASRGTLGWVAGAGAAASAVIRLVEWDGGRGGFWIYFATEARADAPLVGCLLAIILHGRPGRTASPGLATVGLMAMLPLFCTTDALRGLLVPSVAPLLAAVVILAVEPGSYSGWLNTPWLVWVGRRSYALYLWNFPLLWIGPSLLPLPPGVSMLLMLATSFALAELSWRYVERPTLSRTRRRAVARGQSCEEGLATMVPSASIRGDGATGASRPDRLAGRSREPRSHIDS